VNLAGCDLLHSFILGKEPIDVHDEDEEKREKRKIENHPKVYNRNDLKLQSMLGIILWVLIFLKAHYASEMNSFFLS
jgi:hypothetical protein